MSRGARSNDGAFAFLYPLAFLGAHLGFMPLLVLLLPRRVAALAPGDEIRQLSIALLVGGTTASIAHLAAGRWSDHVFDRRGNRRLPIALGLGALAVSYGALTLAHDLPFLLAAVVAFQLALNLMFAPLGALLADYVPHERKGRMTAWLTLALPVSTAASGLLAFWWPRDSDAAFATVAAAILACVLPLLLFWPARPPFPAARSPVAGRESTLPMGDFWLAWSARLLVQCGAALVIHYLYVFLAGLPASARVPMPVSSALSWLLTLAAVMAAIATLAAGYLSDRIARRRLPMMASGLALAVGLVILAATPPWPWLVLAYCLFSGGLTIFLSLDGALVATLLSPSSRRGKWLGVMNLTNTLPAIITPSLALVAAAALPAAGLVILLIAAAAGAIAACFLVSRIRSVA